MDERNSAESTDKRIELRIGIHVGDIIIYSDDIFGDGVNIAARLEGIADPGGVCFSRAAYEQVKGKLDVLFENGGEQKLKNITQSVHVYHVKIGKKSPVRPSAVSLPENIRLPNDVLSVSFASIWLSRLSGLPPLLS